MQVSIWKHFWCAWYFLLLLLLFQWQNALFSNGVRELFAVQYLQVLLSVLIRVYFRLTVGNTRVQACCFWSYSLEPVLFLISLGGLSPWDMCVRTKDCTNKLLYQTQLSQPPWEEQYMASQQLDFKYKCLKWMLCLEETPLEAFELMASSLEGEGHQ